MNSAARVKVHRLINCILHYSINSQKKLSMNWKLSISCLVGVSEQLAPLRFWNIRVGVNLKLIWTVLHFRALHKLQNNVIRISSEKKNRCCFCLLSLKVVPCHVFHHRYSVISYQFPFSDATLAFVLTVQFQFIFYLSSYHLLNIYIYLASNSGFGIINFSVEIIAIIKTLMRVQSRENHGIWFFRKWIRGTPPPNGKGNP